MRARAQRRFNSRNKALRKQKLAREIYKSCLTDSNGNVKEYYANLHQYSENKVHCSCGMCSAKTRNKGKRRRQGVYSPSINYTISDIRKVQSMNFSKEESQNLIFF